jgi:hypothetical protein
VTDEPAFLHRPPTCRREHCAEEATDPVVQLCPEHLAAYEHDAARVLARTRNVKASR